MHIKGYFRDHCESRPCNVKIPTSITLLGWLVLGEVKGIILWEVSLVNKTDYQVKLFLFSQRSLLQFIKYRCVKYTWHHLLEKAYPSTMYFNISVTNLLSIQSCFYIFQHHICHIILGNNLRKFTENAIKHVQNCCFNTLRSYNYVSRQKHILPYFVCSGLFSFIPS